MRIAVTAIFLNSGPLEGYGHYSLELLRQLVDQSGHQFLFLYDRPLTSFPLQHPRITHQVVRPATRQPLSQAIWYHFSATRLVRSWKADVWIQPYGFSSFCTKTPQLTIVHDLASFHLPDVLPWYHRWNYRLFTGRALKKATLLAAVSNSTREDMQHVFPFLHSKSIELLPGASRSVFHPLDWEEKNAIKSRYTGGQEYFLVAGSIHPRKDLMTVLKAFSLFKKWQKSSMKLVIAGRWAWQNEELQEKINSYKYRDELVITGYIPEEELTLLTGAAYALIYPSLWEGFGLPILEAMQSGIPVIASNHPSLVETGGKVALYFDAGQPELLYEQCLRLYKDESLKSRLITEGIQRAQLYSWENTARELNRLLYQVVTEERKESETTKS
ncbi:MAG: glycosyltransferase family 4 protein [Sediminibacterium sp.]